MTKRQTTAPTPAAQRAASLLALAVAMEADGFKNLSIPEIQAFGALLKDALRDAGLLPA